MSLTLHQQAKNLIDKSEKILLVAHTKMDGDTLSSAIAMHLILQKMDKDTVVACADPVPEEFSFLPNTNVMKREISAGKDFVISLDCSRTRAQKLRWKIEGEQLKIFVSPSGGQFAKEDVSFFEHTDFDLILSLDAADQKQLGRIFEDNSELFARVPMIVFDHHASNPGFGTVNIIDTKAASTTEVIYHFLPELFGEDWEKYVDSDIATLLLTGIITDTGSFQNPNTTPRSLEVSADLVELGARQQEIIRNIFKTKNLQTLRLWGRVLSKINTDPMHRMLWSTVSANDLIDTGGMIEDTGGIIDELLATAPGMEMVLLIKERKDGMITVSIRTTTPLCDAAEFSAEFGGGGHTQAAGFKIRGNRPFDVVVGEVISSAQRFQSNRLHLPDEEKKEEPHTKNTSKKEDFSAKVEIVEEQQKKDEYLLPVQIEANPENEGILVEIPEYNKTKSEPSEKPNDESYKKTKRKRQGKKRQTLKMLKNQKKK
jgi:phosphoesterase RecJ-like protein